jgi:hypothetical protein
MRTIIDSSPLSSPAWISLPHGQRIEFLSRQTIVWLSVTPPTFIALASQWPRFPAVVDSGFNSTFLMSEQRTAKRVGSVTPPVLMLGIVPAPQKLKRRYGQDQVGTRFHQGPYRHQAFTIRVNVFQHVHHHHEVEVGHLPGGMSWGRLPWCTVT